jgi:hypothetical protein
VSEADKQKWWAYDEGKAECVQSGNLYRQKYLICKSFPYYMYIYVYIYKKKGNRNRGNVQELHMERGARRAGEYWTHTHSLSMLLKKKQ